MSRRLVYFNGDFIPAQEARIQLLGAWSAEVGLDIPTQARQYAELALTWKP